MRLREIVARMAERRAQGESDDDSDESSEFKARRREFRQDL